MRSSVLACSLALVLAMAGPRPAAAIFLSDDGGGRATLYGPIVSGDQKPFAEFLAAPRAQPLRVIYLDSFGGSVEAGILIGRLIRLAGLSTAIDARYKRCTSSCTLIFAGGVNRYNIHGEEVEEGYNASSGLGYHGSYLKGIQGYGPVSNRGTQMMADFYAEMGQPEAATLLAKGKGSSIYRPTGSTTLAMKIATSLAPP